MNPRRYELKYHLSAYSEAHCNQVILQHPASFRKAFPDRQVNNIYFDTPGLTSFLNNVDGVSERKKYRIRWYGEDFDQIDQPVLEQKIKENQVGTKVSVALPSNIDLDLFTSYVHLLKQQHLLPASMQATVSNTYLRSYYISHDTRFRITIDRAIRFGNALVGRYQPTHSIEHVILELKYDEALDVSADFVRQYLPFQRTKFSKYTTGLVAVL